MAKPSTIVPFATTRTEVAIAGVFVSIDADGSLSIDRGYVRPEDERPVRDRGWRGCRMRRSDI